MELFQSIERDLLTSLRERQQEKTAVLRMLKTALKNFTIAKRMPESSLTDEQVVGVVRQEVKKRKESIAAFMSGGRGELADKERREMEMLEAYVPPGMSVEELSGIITSVVSGENLSPPYQFGRLMGLVVKKVAGRADGETVKQAVQAFVEKS